MGMRLQHPLDREVSAAAAPAGWRPPTSRRPCRCGDRSRARGRSRPRVSSPGRTPDSSRCWWARRRRPGWPGHLSWESHSCRKRSCCLTYILVISKLAIPYTRNEPMPKAPRDLAVFDGQRRARCRRPAGARQRAAPDDPVQAGRVGRGHGRDALAEAVGLSQSALSQHLAKMREEGIVTYRRESQTLWYRIADPRTETLLGHLQQLYCPPEAPAPKRKAKPTKERERS